MGTVRSSLSSIDQKLKNTFCRDDMMKSREEAERLANISGKSAQNERKAGGTFDPNYQLPSQKIANAPYIANVLSSGSNAQDRRKKGGTWEGERRKEKGEKGKK